VKTAADRQDLGVLVQVLRALRNWDQSELAAAAGLDNAAISRYESGTSVPRRSTLERLARAVGMPMRAVDTLLMPVIRMLLTLSAPRTRGSLPLKLSGALGETGKSSGAMVEALADAAASALGIAEAELVGLWASGESQRTCPSAADRSEAAELWARLELCTAMERRWLIERLREFQQWALAERLWDESVRAAADDSSVALQLARLALRVAQLADGDPAWLSLLQGLSRGFVGNALRVEGELRAAEAEFAAAWQLWDQGAGGDPDRILPEWRLPDLEASLRRELRQFGAAFELLDRAAECGPREVAGRILLNRAFTLERAEDLEGAAAALRKAAPLIDEAGDPRLRWVAEFDLTVIECKLGYFTEAESRLSRLRGLALGNELDLVRVRWLSGWVAGGLGRRDEARSAFEQVRDEFEARRNGFDAALVSLELAVLHLEDGRTGEVRELAKALAWVLREKGIKREALAALRLFCQAAQQETATLQQARLVLVALEKAGGQGMKSRP
jgi:transcriptional regulator with XRE-family HTH domain